MSKTKRRSLAERVSFGVSLFIVSLILLLICFAWVTGDNTSPILSIAMAGEIREINRQYYVPFIVTNTGGETVESVEIVAKLSLAAGDEEGRQQIDFLSRQEQRSGAFVFSKNPQQGKLSLRVASYRLP